MNLPFFVKNVASLRLHCGYIAELLMNFLWRFSELGPFFSAVFISAELMN